MTTNVEITEMPKRADSGVPIVHVAVRGTLTADRYAFLEKGLQELIDRHGTIRVFLVLEEMEGMTADAKEEDRRFEARHFDEIDRVAVACSTCKDAEIPESALPFKDVNTRAFKPGAMEQALKWLSQD